MESRIKKVIVVGAGPAGLLTAHMLGQKGIAVDVVEAGATVNEAPRGLAYGPSANRYASIHCGTFGDDFVFQLLTSQNSSQCRNLQDHD